jgi:hypothetical protein
MAQFVPPPPKKKKKKKKKSRPMGEKVMYTKTDVIQRIISHAHKVLEYAAGPN